MASKQAVFVCGLVLLFAVGSQIVAVANALVPMLLVLAAVVAGLRLLWFFTRF